VPLDRYMRVAEAAAELGVSPRWVVRLIDRGLLRAERAGPQFYLVERDSVTEYQRTRRPAGRPARQTQDGAAEAAST
jgi:excisionase family DNA binding protein